eukprot:683792-Karenia_brevis.AAC.1
MLTSVTASLSVSPARCVSWLRVLSAWTGGTSTHTQVILGMNWLIACANLVEHVGFLFSPGDQ